MSSFLDLPAELRYQIYGYIAIPDTAPLSSYAGLYLSCRQIRLEMESECIKVFRAYLATLQNQLEETHVDLPESFAEMQRLRLNVKTFVFDPRTPRLHNLKAFLSLHLASLSITYLVPENPLTWYEKMHHVVWSVFTVVVQLLREVVNSRQIRAEYPYVTDEDALLFAHRHLAHRFDESMWTVLWERGVGGLSGVWTKANGEGRSQVLAADTTGASLHTRLNGD
jgi:hypothetical protein